MASDFMDLFRFNTENAPDVLYIQNLKKKPTEMFREYATRWRSEAAKVRPALEEEQMNKFFVRAQDPQYYERLMVIENHKFSDIIKLGERIEEGIKSGMVTNFEALQATNKALQSGGISKKKEVVAVMVAQGPKSPHTYQTPSPTYQPSPPRYQQPATTYHTYNTHPACYHSPPARQNYQKPRPNFDRRPPRQYTPIAEPIDQLYQRLKAAGYVTLIPIVAMENSSQWVNPNKTCAYHSGMKGHTIDECHTLKDKIQMLIDTKVIHAKETAPNVRNNPLPDHRGEGVNVVETDEEWDPDGSIRLIRGEDDPKIPPVTLTCIVVQIQSPIEVEGATPTSFEVEVTMPSATPTPFEVEVTTPFTVMIAPTPSFNSNVVPWDYTAEARRKVKEMEETGAAQGMARTGRVYTPEHLGETSKEAASRQPIIETGPDDLWRKVQAREYSVVDHLNKTPAQISILSLLQNSKAHRNALMNVLNEAYVPNNITSGEMANMVGQLLESHKITFHEDELSLEGLSHNKALHITVQYEDKFIVRVLIDGGSSLNICPLTTLKRLGKGLHEIRAGTMNVKAFDGSQRATIGETNHCLQMGPTWFDVEFQVLDISASYNMILERPWIHATRAVASTLHQAVKFEWNHHEVIIHGDGSNPIYTNQTVPVVENRRKLGGETYHHIERVNAIEKDKWWSRKIESILAWIGYEPGRGLGKNIQGITKPIQLKRHGTTFGLGYHYTWHEYQNWSLPWRGPYYPLEQLVPHLSQSFHQADMMWRSEKDEILAGLRNLFLEDENMDCSVIVEEEEEEGLVIQTMEKGAVLRN
ncbi:uncharacterized protein [Nicotiana tomentosiformis]|uniref:uncharacterized protein n=1 Tax=Nicotiana tomentosiformis TaxID=4098 RepID=UPI00388CA201